jgi:tRNA(Ile2)-agmatinylcytidine synthase
VVGYPKLVRLNPNIPWKTRGNGAVCAKLKSKLDPGQVLERVAVMIERVARMDETNTNPGAVVLGSEHSIPADLYWQTVREVVKLEDVIKILEGHGAVYRGFKNRRGLIGATAAISWAMNVAPNPEADRTYEIITYRERSRWGSEREIEVGSVIEMDKKFSSTFNNYDYVNKHISIAPNSPCPVLFGIRGDDPDELPGAMEMIKSEPVDKWVLFETNQCTDDHLQPRPISEIQPYQSTITEGIVRSTPHAIDGGHVIFSISNSDDKIDCAAYEPTKEFRGLVNQLANGDKIKVYGSVRAEPLTINIEKLEIINLVDLNIKRSNPKCLSCGKSMKSVGKGQGYRCKKCSTKLPEDSAEVVNVDRELKPGLYEVPVCARRHLSKPLKRL